MEETVAVCPLAVVICPNIWETFCKRRKEEEEEKNEGVANNKIVLCLGCFSFPTKIHKRTILHVSRGPAWHLLKIHAFTSFIFYLV